MSEDTQVRPDVVEAIVGVLKGGDAAALPEGATAAEKAAAKDSYLSEFVAEPPVPGLGAAAHPQLRRAPDLGPDLRRPRPGGAHRAR